MVAGGCSTSAMARMGLWGGQTPTKSKNTKLKESGGDYFILLVDVTKGHSLPHRPLPATPCLQTSSKTCWLPPVLLRLQYKLLILEILHR